MAKRKVAVKKKKPSVKKVKVTSVEVVPEFVSMEGIPETEALTPIGQYTTAIQIIKGIERGELQVKGLSVIQRRACVAELLRQGIPKFQIAELFEVCPATITADRRWILKATADSFLHEFDPVAFIGWIREEAEYHISKFKQNKEYASSWSVITEFARLMLLFGVIVPGRGAGNGDQQQSPHKPVDPLGHLSDEQLAEVERIVSKGS